MANPISKRIILLVLFFLMIGQIMLFSATGVLGLERFGSEFYYSTRQGIATLMGLGLMFLLSRINYQTWRKVCYPLALILFLFLVAMAFSQLGHNAQGATRWIRLGFFSFQPSELAKIVLPLYVAHLLAKGEGQPFSWKRWLIQGVFLFAILSAIYKQPDLGSTVLFLTMMLGLLFIAGLRPIYLVLLFSSGFTFSIVSILNSEYRRRRLFAFLNPWADAQGSGFQTIQSLLSLHSGQVVGIGIGNGNSKLFYLPEVHTDFIFSLIGEELGFLGAIALILLFVYFCYLLFKVAFRAPDSFGCYFAFGLSLCLMLQIVVNLGGVTGLLPIKGLPLPFISWGRSALLVNLMMVGILLNISRQSGIMPKPPEASPKPI